MLGKILGLVSLGGTLSGIRLTKKFIVTFAAILGLTIMGAVVAGGLALFSIYEGHAMLVRHGLDPDVAALLTCLLGLLVLAAIGVAIAYKARHLQSSALDLSPVSSASSSAISAVKGFYRGLTNKDLF